MEKVKTSYKSLEVIDVVALVLLFIGGINWGLLSVVNWNLVHAIFRFSLPLERFIYGLVGLSAIYMAVVTPLLLKRHQVEQHPATPTPQI